MIFGRLIHRWNKWRDWTVYAKEKNYGPVKLLLIFLGIIHDSWFENFVYWKGNGNT